MDVNVSYKVSKEDLVGVLRTILLFLDSLSFDATSAVFRTECTSKGYDEIISTPAKLLIVQSFENLQQPKNETKTQESQTPFSIAEASESYVLDGFVQHASPPNSVQLSNKSVNALDDVGDDKSEVVYLKKVQIETSNPRIKQYPNTAEPKTEYSNDLKYLRKTQSAPSIRSTASEITEDSIKDDYDVEEKDIPAVSCTPTKNCKELKRKFKQLQVDHHKLMSVTVELTSALQTYILGQCENFNSALNNCKTIYPDLFQPDDLQKVEKSENIESVEQSNSDAQIQQSLPLEGKVLCEILVDANDESFSQSEQSATKSPSQQTLQVPRKVKSFTIVLTEPQPVTDVNEETIHRKIVTPEKVAPTVSSVDTQTDSETPEPTKTDTNEHVQDNFRHSPEASYSEETKQFYHVPSSKTGIFETQKNRKLHRVPPSFTRTIPMSTTMERPSYMCTANSFCPQVYSKVKPIIPKERSSVNNPPYALDHYNCFKVCYRDNHNCQNKTNCDCKDNTEYNKYRCNCYNIIKGYLEQSPEEYVTQDTESNHCVCRPSKDESNVKRKRSSKSPVTVNKMDSEADITNFCYKELHAALNVADFKELSNSEAEAAFQSRPKLLRTPPQMKF